MIIVADTREQRPYRFKAAGAPLVRYALRTGDYSVVGFERLIAVERKSSPDFLHSIGTDRKRFFAELERLSMIPYPLIVVEATMANLAATQWSGYSNLNEAQINAAIVAILARYRIPLLTVGIRSIGEDIVYRFLRSAMQAIATYDKWGSAFTRRHVASFVCQECGLTKHDDESTLSDWRTAMPKTGAGVPFALCPGCYDSHKAPQGYLWRRKKG